jgi:hypothetical protein
VRKKSWSTSWLSPKIQWKGWGRSRESLNRIIGLRAKIRTRDFPNKKQYWHIDQDFKNLGLNNPVKRFRGLTVPGKSEEKYTLWEKEKVIGHCYLCPLNSAACSLVLCSTLWQRFLVRQTVSLWWWSWFSNDPGMAYFKALDQRQPG